jgi:predicted  nucleic acid-binding Zn-ribbon protein
MSFVIFKGEKNIEDLVSRIFHLPNKSAKASQDAQDALLQANPQLKDLSKVPMGSVLEVPSTASPVNETEQAPASVVRWITATRQAHESLSAIDQRLTDIEQQAKDAGEAFVSLAKSRQFASIVKSDQFKSMAETIPALNEQRSLLTGSLKSITKAVQNQQKARTQAISETLKQSLLV